MKALLIPIFCLLATAALAQAPGGTLTRPPQESNPAASGGKPAAQGQANTEAKTGMPGMAGKAAPATMNTSTMGNKAMDLNGDGMISRKEWDAHHGKMWSGMKANKQGMVPWTDVEARMKGGPN